MHSPFLYEWITEVIYGATERGTTRAIEEQRTKLLHDERLIKINDLGAGSKVSKNSVRSVASIAKNALKSRKYSELIYRIAQRTQPETVLELGTSLGISAAYLAKGAPGAHVTTMEGCKNTAAVAQETFEALDIENVELINAPFEEALPTYLNQIKNLDLAFFDGNHRYEPTMQYFKWCLPSAHQQTVFIFDDIHWSKEMTKAWDAIKSHPEVVATLDLFILGVVFFNKELTPQHLTIRY